MKLFPYAHATHPQWPMAAALVLAQLRAQMALEAYADSPTLALLYITDPWAESAREILDHLAAELPLVTDWAGTVGVGVLSNNAEYFNEPAMAVMLLELPGDQYRVFSGISPLHGGFEAHSALIHVDGTTPDLPDLVQEMALRTSGSYLFGGLSSSRVRGVQFAVAADGNIGGQGAATGVFSGGLSGVAFGGDIHIVSRVTQGCQPVSKVRTVTQAWHNMVITLDNAPALDVLLQDLGVTMAQPQEALEAVRNTLVGLCDEYEPLIGQTGYFGNQATVRHIVGIDPMQRGVAVADHVQEGMQLAFCQRNSRAARADLTRICAEIREELEPADMPLQTATALAGSEAQAAPHPARRIAGAVYISCAGRGGGHFGSAGAELQLVRRVLGDVPLVGFFADGEVAYNHLYGYTGVLTVFVSGSAI